MTKEEIASKEACRILREHYIGLDHPNIDAYDDAYVINNYPFEWSLYMDGWKSENERLKSELSGNPEQLGWISVKDFRNFIRIHHLSSKWDEFIANKTP